MASPSGGSDGPPKAAAIAVDQMAQKFKSVIRARLGEEIFSTWFNAFEVDSFDGKLVRCSVPVKFLRKWIQQHYESELLACAQAAFKGSERIEVTLRQPVATTLKAPEGPARDTRAVDGAAEGQASRPTPIRVQVPAMPAGAGRTQVGPFEGSPLDPRYTFDSFVVGNANRMAHAAAVQAAETVLNDARSNNPLYIHSAVGLGKTHLLQAIAWSVKERFANAQILYLTAERFRYQFVDALRSQDAMAFKEKFRQIDILLIDDLEFMQGEKTEQEFDHIINSLLDGGRQVVVASARPPSQIERLNERMRSRLQRGLTAELEPFDVELRHKVLDRRVQEKRSIDPSFDLSREIRQLLVDRLTENGRELEGAVTRLFATWQLMRSPLTPDIAETVIRDLVQGIEPRRIKIEDILKIVSRHFGVSKGDLLSQRRDRSVDWPRQIGMYLAKQLTARSLPEIGRRFGNRDHTTVLHAIRKIEGELTDNPRLRDELEELKRMLNH